MKNEHVSLPHDFPPNGLSRSGLACWWSIRHLIQTATAEGVACYLWTLTFAKTYPDSWCGNMHGRLVTALHHDTRNPRNNLPLFAGVRVSELHPSGHGLHFHWVIKGRLPLDLVRKRAKQSGFGHVFIARDKRNRFRKIDVGAAGYLAKYLTKGDKLKGVRSWACIGNYNGTKTRDIEFDSDSNRVFRAAYRTAKQLGTAPPLCFQAAVLAQRNFNHHADQRDPCFAPRLAELTLAAMAERKSASSELAGGAIANGQGLGSVERQSEICLSVV